MNQAMIKKYFYFALLLLSSCSTRQIQQDQERNAASMVVNGKLFATVFQARAAEYHALCLQAYNSARFRVTSYQAISSRPLAIITDIDETVLDNSPYQAERTLQRKDYDQASWFAWTKKLLRIQCPVLLHF